jgi:Organic solute transporter Ostalpha
MVINNFSQAWALYVLMLFYVAMHAELLPLNPLRKFVTIKLVVFFSFWQGLVITILCALKILQPGDSMRTFRTREHLSGGLQDFIICIEMFFAAIGFAWSFPPRDYMTVEPPGFWKSVYALFDMADVVDDVQGVLLISLLQANCTAQGVNRAGMSAGRVHEEYQEITTRPIQKIIAPLRNTPLFAKAIITKSGSGADATDLVPLTCAAHHSDAMPAVPGGRGNVLAFNTRGTLSPETPGRGSITGGSAQEPFSEIPAIILDHGVGSISGDAGRAMGSSSDTDGGGSAIAALLVSKNSRAGSRGKMQASKLQSHVD